ncbi:MAG: glycosyltransferase [Xanthomonadales bacterium]|nr:glycosyltransferase [Xanthomonadales bacterium]
MLTVLQVLPALDSGGVEQSTLEISDALVAAGHRSVVASAGGRLLPALLAGGAEHHRLAVGRKSPALLPAALRLRRLLRGLRPDIVHARSRLPAWLAWWALRGLPDGQRPRFVTTAHGLNSPGRYSAIMARGERVIAVSATVRDWLLRHYPVPPARIEVIPRGIDPARWRCDLADAAAWRARLEQAHPALAGRRLLVLPGRGTRLKGHVDAIAVLAGLVAAGTDAALLLQGAADTGRPAYLEGLRAQAGRHGVGDRLVIAPASADIVGTLACADLVLQLSSRPEAFGRTVIEALSLGRPVLGWAHGGVGELLAELYPEGAVAPGDIAGAVARAGALLADAPRPGPVPYTLSAMQERTLALYQRLVGSASR